MRATMVLVLSFAAAAGCAHSGGARSASSSEVSPAMADAYRAVRSGAKATDTAGRYRFCATPRGLDVMTRVNVGTSQWNDIARNTEIESSVREAIRHDPALQGSDIQVKTVRGEVILTGQVPSDEAAIRATKVALDAEGVPFVNVAMTSPQSPGPPATMDNPYPSCRL